VIVDSPNSEPAWRPEVVPGERVFLSQVQREDLPWFARWFSDLELNTYLGLPGMSFMPEHEDEWYDRVVKDRNAKTFAIVLREGQRPIGSIGFHHVDASKGVTEVGIAIGDKTAWGQGYGSEALRLMCDYGFTFLGLHTIYLWHTEFNRRGHHSYLKAGFKLAGRIRGADVFDGRRYDRILMDITREDFGPSRLRGLIGQLDGESNERKP
jgi:RimJ/RimL family protein N-acetyltransferase